MVLSYCKTPEKQLEHELVKKSSIAIAQKSGDPHSLYTALKRLFHTIVVGSVLASAVVLILLFQQYQNDWLNVQTRFSGESIARQYAKLLAPAFSIESAVSQGSSNNSETSTQLSKATVNPLQIESIVDVLLQEPHILSLSVFDRQGKYIAPLPRIDSVVTLNKNEDFTPLTYVSTIFDESNQVVGYVNVHMNTLAVLESPLSLRYQLTFIACILMFFALTMGIYLTRLFYKSRPWVIQVINAKNR